MRRAISIGYFAICLSWVLALASAKAQDSADSFLQAYQLYQSGEKLEGESDPQRALLRYRDAEKILQKLATSDPSWQPLVVEYRLKRTRENISRLETRTAGMPPLDEELEGALPSAEEAAKSSPAELPPVSTIPVPGMPKRQKPVPPQTPARTQGDSAALDDARREIAGLKKELNSAKRENDRLSAKVEKTAAELKSAIFEIDRTKVNMVELKSQLAQANDTVDNLKRDKGDTATIRADRDKEIATFLQRAAEADADTEVLREENERLLAKLENAAKYIQSSDAIRSGLVAERSDLAKARDAARADADSSKRLAEENQKKLDAARAEADEKLKTASAEVEKLNSANKKLESDLAAAKKAGASAPKLAALEKENADLAKKLAEAKKSAESAGDSAAMASLKSELNGVNDRLLEAQAALSGRDARIDDLAKQLDDASGELARLRLLPVPSSEEQKLLAENDLLRGIILRQIKQQNRRDEARDALEQQISTLKIQSDDLKSHLAVLSSPVLELTPEERTLFKDPVSLLTEPAPGVLEVDMAITKPTEGEAARNLQAGSPQGPEALDDDAKTKVRSAQEAFSEKNYLEAERLYQSIVAANPDNHFALSNLGAVQIEAGKLSAAEIALKKAASLSPKDSFALTHLGIAYSRQSRFPEAQKTLENAVSLNPQDSVAHNYLGVCLAQQGDPQAAEKELKTAIEIDPNYANAHFNLAVLYATIKPPDTDLAKQHYKLATDLGAPPDSSLERLIQ